MRDPYEVLGLDRGADESELKAAFRRAAAKHHPDRNPGDADAQRRFTEVNGAYQILSDPEKRAAYDRYGSRAFEPGGGAEYTAAAPDLADLDGILGDLLGAFGFRTARSPAVLQVTMPLTFEEAALGCAKVLRYEAQGLCADCSGRGAKSGTSFKTCPQCQGTGRLRLAQGAFIVGFERHCPACAGRGRVPTLPCRRCAGGGLSQESRSVDIEVPAGIMTGSAQTIRGAGHRSSPDSPPGDLEVVVDVASHSTLQRSGDDIKSMLEVPFTVAALGGQLDVETLRGIRSVKVPPGTQPGDVLRIRDEGVAKRRGGLGDHLAVVDVQIPRRLSRRARDLVAEFAREMEDQERGRSEGFWSRIRNWFA